MEDMFFGERLFNNCGLPIYVDDAQGHGICIPDRNMGQVPYFCDARLCSELKSLADKNRGPVIFMEEMKIFHGVFKDKSGRYFMWGPARLDSMSHVTLALYKHKFHFGAIDVGLPAAGICSVKTQKDRGLAYRYYYEQGMKSPYFVGAHYFILNDQPVLGRFDGENTQIGLVDVCNKPYEDFVAEVQRTNSSVYAMAAGDYVMEEYEVGRIPRLMGF